MVAEISSTSNHDEKKIIMDVQHFQSYWSTDNGGTEFMKICTAKETHEINLKEYAVTIRQTMERVDQKINGERKGGRPKKEATEEKTGPQLKIRSLDSEVVRAGVYIRQENKTILLDIKDPLAENRIRLTAEEWLNFCDEIHTMVHQFDMKEA